MNIHERSFVFRGYGNEYANYATNYSPSSEHGEADVGLQTYQQVHDVQHEQLQQQNYEEQLNNYHPQSHVEHYVEQSENSANSGKNKAYDEDGAYDYQKYHKDDEQVVSGFGSLSF